MGKRMMWFLGSVLPGVLLCAVAVVPAEASETTAYTYDALGQLVATSNSGTINNGLTTATAFDNAGNRTNHAVNPNGPLPSFAISNAAAVTEGGMLVYTVTKTGSTTGTFTVQYATANGTATAGSDYATASGTLTFLSSDVTKTISVSTTDDSTAESAETVLVNLSSPSGGSTVTNSQGSGTINDNDTWIMLTDMYLQVFPQYASTYYCEFYSGYNYQECYLLPNFDLIYYGDGGYTYYISPNYQVIPGIYMLRVLSPYFGQP